MLNETNDLFAKMEFQDALELLYKTWQEYKYLNPLPIITMSTGVFILQLLETHEQYQTKSSIENYQRWQFYKTVYEKACESYPMAMKRAEVCYFN